MDRIRLCAHELCTGCLACYNSCGFDAINIVYDEEGFVNPQIDSGKCKQCGKCMKVCPVINPLPKLQYEQFGYACWNQDKGIVRNSSSGGCFTSLAEFILHAGGVVVGAAFDKDFFVRHIMIDNIDDLSKLRCSKYVQSDISTIFQDVKTYLQRKIKVLFVGTPCQVAGLKRYLCKNYDNLITCDFVCHGVPSPLIFKKYKDWLEEKYESTLKRYIFRDKRWSWMSFNIKAEFANGKVYYGTWFKDEFLRLFLGELISRKCCYKCQYTNMNRPADITLADFWGLEFAKDEKKNYSDTGISLALINSEKGNELFEKVKHSMISYKRTAEVIEASQKSFSSPWEEPVLRKHFWNDYFRLTFPELLIKYAQERKTPLDKKILFFMGRSKMTILICKVLNKLGIK